MAKVPSNKITSGDIQDLAVAVEQLTEETRILRQSIDELRDDVVWAARQVLSAGDTVSPGYLASRQRDPFVPNAELNGQVTPNEDEYMHEGAPYCCDAPRLVWNGDPDAPGIACRNCGYVVADMGSVLIWREDTPRAATASSCETGAIPKERQAALFD